MKNIKQFLFIGIILVFIANIFNSCAPAYIPNAVNMPLISNKGEVQLAIHAGVCGFDPQVTVAVSDHIAIMANGSFQNEESDTSDNYHKHYFGEIGVGYYTTIQNLARFEVYGGYGYGKVQIRNNGLFNSSVVSDVLYHRIFLQPTFGFTSAFFDMGFAPRIVLIRMMPKQFTYKTITKPFIEPVGTIKLGYKYFFIITQLGFSFPLFNTDNQEWFDYNPFIFSIGIQFKFGKIYDTQASYN